MANGAAQPVPTSAPTTKVIGATGGSAVGSQIATIILRAIESIFNYHFPENVKTAIAGLIAAIVAFLAGYYVPHGGGETVINQGGQTLSARIPPHA